MKKLKKDPKTIKKLKKWLTTHTTSEIALALGYKSSTTINQWIQRGRVSEREKSNLLKVISK